MSEKTYEKADDFLEDSGRVYEDVELPDGKFVCVQSLTALEKDQFEAGTVRMQQVGRNQVPVMDRRGMRARILIACVVDPKTRKPLFHEEDLAKLNQKNVGVVDKIVEVCMRLSAWDAADIDEKKEELKNDQPAA